MTCCKTVIKKLQTNMVEKLWCDKINSKFGQQN